MENAGVEKAWAEKAGAEKAGTTKITVPNNKNSTISLNKYQSFLPYLPKEDYQAPLRALILGELEKMDGLSRGELREELVSWFGLTPEYAGADWDGERLARSLSVVDYMAGAIHSGQPLPLRGGTVSPEELAARFLQLSQEEIAEVGERVAERMAAGEVRNPRAYVLSALYDQTISGKLEELP